jgi:hypothetical protein
VLQESNNSSASNWPEAVVYHTTKVDLAKHLKIAKIPDNPGATLPAYGEAYDSCGTVRFRVKCENDHYGLRVNSCNRKECPVCSNKWANRQARKAAKRFWWIFENSPAGSRPENARHISLDVGHGVFEGLPYVEAVKAGAKAIRDSLRSGGGLYVPHGWRFKDSSGDPVQWKHSDLNPSADYPIIDSYAVYSPHVHFVIFGWLIPVEEFEAKYGCRYTYHSATPSELEVYFSVRYMLTHTTLIENRHSLVWFSGCSYNRVVLDREYKETVRALCPECNAPMFRETPEGDWEAWHIEVTRRHYKFKVDQEYLVKKKRAKCVGGSSAIYDLKHSKQVALGQQVDSIRSTS